MPKGSDFDLELSSNVRLRFVDAKVEIWNKASPLVIYAEFRFCIKDDESTKFLVDGEAVTVLLAHVDALKTALENEETIRLALNSEIEIVLSQKQ